MTFRFTSEELNKHIPLIIPFSKWFQAVLTFYIRLSERLNGNLVEIIAAPNEDMLFHGYNVIVLVKSVTPGIYELVARIEEEISKKYDWQPSISSYVTRNKLLIKYLKGQLRWRSMKS